MAVKKVHYPAVIDKDPDSDYGVVFPDFPGCVSAGSTLDEAVLGAHEALAGHVALMVADGDALPSRHRLRSWPHSATHRRSPSRWCQ